MITYEVAEYEVGDKTVEVSYINDDNGFVYKRQVNIPYIDEETINEDYFEQILEGQLRGVEHKFYIGVITFTDPNEVSVGIAST
jgi:hypothetical protein